jgi:hypothetical protein
MRAGLAGQPRRKVLEPHGAYVRGVLAAKPLAYWRMNEFGGPTAFDCTGNGNNGTYEDLIAFYLPGPEGEQFSGEKINRCALFAGGSMSVRANELGDHYTVSLWFWNGFPPDARPVTGYLFSRGPSGARGDHLGIGGTEGAQSKLFFTNEGKTEIPMRTWTHVVLVRQGDSIHVYLSGKLEIGGKSPIQYSPHFETLYVGGRNDKKFCFEGRIDEVAVYNRAMTSDQIIF